MTDAGRAQRLLREFDEYRNVRNEEIRRIEGRRASVASGAHSLDEGSTAVANVKDTEHLGETADRDYDLMLRDTARLKLELAEQTDRAWVFERALEALADETRMGPDRVKALVTRFTEERAAQHLGTRVAVTSLPRRSSQRQNTKNASHVHPQLLSVSANNSSTNLASPATSVTYTTSRITIKSPAKNTNSRVKRSAEKQRRNSTELALHYSPTPKNQFSPDSKANLTDFSQLLDESFDQESPQHWPPKNELTSPVNFNKISQSQALAPQNSGSLSKRSINTSFSSNSKSANAENNFSPVSYVTSPGGSSSVQVNTDSPSKVDSSPAHEDLPSRSTSNDVPVKPSRVASGPDSKNSANYQSDIPLFVEPKDFGTILVDIVSTLYQEPISTMAINNHDIDQMDINSVLLSALDRGSGKEMFKFAKSYQKIKELDVYMRSHVPTLSLPCLPEKALMFSTMPLKISQRKEQLDAYFKSIFSVPDYPSNVALKVAQFISTDTVIIPPFVGDNVMKEGHLIVRKPKALSTGNNWKIRYAVLNEETLQFWDRTHVVDSLKIKNSTLDILPNLPEDKYGTKNGFLINEQRKTGLSSTIKFYICAESAKERELWIKILNELMDPGRFFQVSKSKSNEENASVTNFMESSHMTDNSTYVTDLTNDSSQLNRTPGHLSMNADATSTSGSATSSINAELLTDDKEAKRNKMRSLFPFKKFNQLGSGGTVNTVNNNNLAIAMSNSSEATSNNEIDTFDRESIRSSTFTGQPSIFGSNLEDCLRLSSHKYQGHYDLPSIVYRCLEYLYKNRGIMEEGIFRLSGSSAVIKILQDRFEKDHDVDLCAYNDEIDVQSSGNFIGVNTISGLLKLYLRKLPHLIFGDENYEVFQRIVESYHRDQKRVALEFSNVIRSGAVPHPHISLMYALFELMFKVDEHNNINKMNLRNICIVFSPALSIPINILQPFVVDFGCIFLGKPPIEDSKRQTLDIQIPQY